MELMLSENIRSLRKQRKLTQEQLAEVLGVTAGAVYKWEAGLSLPELDLIVELADFFDTSVDALLGYGIRDNRMGSILERMGAYCRNGDPQALAEAEKALKKYPHSFEVVHSCAQIYNIFGSESHSREQLQRAVELLEQSLLLIGQNTDPEISEYTIYGEIGGAYISMGEQDKGLELMKKHNMGGIFSDSIGVTMALFFPQKDEAEPYLFEALLRSITSLVNTVAGYTCTLCAKGKYTQAEEICLWGQELLMGLRRDAAPDFLDKTQASLLVLLAHTKLCSGKDAEALDVVREAADYARRFDADPDYGINAIQFFSAHERLSIHDSLGVTAAESIEFLIRTLKDQSLEAMWRETANHE